MMRSQKPMMNSGNCILKAEAVFVVTIIYGQRDSDVD